MLLRTMSGIANGLPLSFLVLVLISTVTGLSITLILSVIYRQLINRRPIVTWGVTALVLPFAVALYAFIDAWVNGLYSGDAATGFAQRILGLFYLDGTLLGARSITWSTFSSRSRNRTTSCCGWRTRRPRLSWRCCATSSTRTSCSTP
jgi:hypothetical protein